MWQAVVSQPFDRDSFVAAPGPLDTSLGEFWVENPWDIASRGHNLSAFERKRAYLNVADPDGGRNFLDISYLTGADGDGDGRSIVAADFRNNGQLDLVLRQVGGGPIFIYENHFPQRHYLQVSLRGHRDPEARVTSNRFGIGARLGRADQPAQAEHEHQGGQHSHGVISSGRARCPRP